MAPDHIECYIESFPDGGPVFQGFKEDIERLSSPVVSRVDPLNIEGGGDTLFQCSRFCHFYFLPLESIGPFGSIDSGA